MLVLVSSPTLIQILIGWELVGVCSYLLIGHYWEKKDNSSAAMKAFITNKIADIGLMIGIIILALNTGTLRISEILYQSTHDYEKLIKGGLCCSYLCFLLEPWAKVLSFPFMFGYLMQWQVQHLYLH
jgi:NADH:ubiquinone oxidoreductase subunit 5 (subunit L)/multisubunit Na+/H+ antiporter MnhA subunit